MNYYPHHIGDYLRDTSHLSMLEDAAYRRMLDLYYASERPLPLNVGGLYRLVRARSREEKLAVDTVLGEFFSKGETGWSNKRADEEIAKSKEKTEKARASAEVRWHSAKNANAMRTHSEGNAPKTNNQNQNQNQRVGQQRSRGSRLPTDWKPSEILEAWASKERPDLEIPTTVAKFKDFFLAAPGSKGVKLDWDATFRNWVRAERPGNKSAPPDYSAVIANLKD